MTMTSSISVVSSQMQLMNVVECIKSHNYRNNILIVVSATNKREADIKKLLRENDVYGIFFCGVFYFRFRENLFVQLIQTVLYLIRVRMITFQKCFHNVIIGNYLLFTHRYVIKAITRNDCAPNVYVVDDGMATIKIVRYREKEKQEKCISLFLPFYHRAVSIHFLFKRFFIQQLCFYTIYSIKNVSDDMVEKNEYEFLKNNYKRNIGESQRIKEQIIFLGQPLCEHNVMSTKVLNEHMRKIQCMFPDCGCIAYYMHPAERKKKELQYESVIEYENKMNVEMLALSLPAKTKVLSFYSSSLITIKRLRNDIDLYCVYEDSLVKNNAQLEDIYKMLVAEGVFMIK